MYSKIAAVVLVAVMILAVAIPISEAAAVDSDKVEAPDTGLSAPLPSSYDLRDHYDVTPVKDQLEYGTCTQFATMSSLEQLLLRDGYGQHDLSELYLAGSQYTGYGAPSGSGGDEFWTVIEPSEQAFGSYSWLTALRLIDWAGGPIEEDLAPYGDREPDYVSDPSLEDEAVAHVTGFRFIDPISDPDTVKAMVMDGYAGIMMLDASGMYPLDGTLTCNVPMDTPINHAVAVVGWDDDYPRDGFYIPAEEDGAWLVKNSMGTSLGIYEGDGYMWVSYGSSIMPGVLFLDDCEDASESRHLYSYDHGLSVGSDMAFDGRATAANVFTATGDQVVDAVSFTTLSMSDVSYTVQVYRDLRDPGDPTSGTPCIFGGIRGSIDAAGAYQIDLGDGVRVSEGETFSVVVSFEGDGTVYVPLDTDEDLYSLGTEECHFRPSANAGESFVMVDGQWTDVSADGSTNVRIKAYANDAEDGDSGVLAALAVVMIAAVVVALTSRR